MRKKTNQPKPHPSSFRDPSGYIFTYENCLLRRINFSYQKDYDLLINSGLYQRLAEFGLLISHREIKNKFGPDAYKIIEPDPIPFISYPYEWCFGQLKDAALLTLKVQKEALGFDMSLKDASSFNIQYVNGKPIFIDTLSFTEYHPGQPWVAYKQFCEHFLAPLALSCYADSRLVELEKSYLDGIPLELVTKLLPFKAKINPGLFLHLVLHAESKKKFAFSTEVAKKKTSFSRQSFFGLIDNLESLIKNLSPAYDKTVWTDYYDNNNKSVSYNNSSFIKKRGLITEFLQLIKPRTLWDIGANTGVFSRLSAGLGIFTVSLDSDPSVVEENYLEVKKTGVKNLLPLVIDITSPSPAVGFENQERSSFLSRAHPDAVMALALIHHLAISHNLPLSHLAGFFSRLCNFLLIEFVPKEDKQVELLLRNRQDIFSDYTPSAFEKEFARYFRLLKKTVLINSKRTLYLWKKK